MKCIVIFLRFVATILSPIIFMISLIVSAFGYIILGDRCEMYPFDFIDKFYDKLGKL